MVGLERTFDQVSEGVGVVEVCVIVDSPSVECPIQFSFDVRLSTTNGTAGELITIILIVILILVFHSLSK